MKIVFLGLSITSSWGNGHATTYRGLISELAKRDHDITFLERDVPWYAENRDLPRPLYCETLLYKNLDELKRWVATIAEADAVIVGSYVTEGVAVIEWVLQHARGLVAFYDIDTPVTLAKLARGDFEYISPKVIPKLDLYLSFTGGPSLSFIERTLGASSARALYCSVDPKIYYPESRAQEWALGYLGTYSEDRQPTLHELLVKPAASLPTQRFVVAGSLYPREIDWPGNVRRIEHLAPSAHRDFYNSQAFTLNVTRRDMIRAGWSPSVRLFEAAACGAPVISDTWEGMDNFFRADRDILLAQNAEEVRSILIDLPDADRLRISGNARQRVLAEHTAAHRAGELEEMLRPHSSGPIAPALTPINTPSSIPLQQLTA